MNQTDKLEERVCKLEEKISNQEKVALTDRYELSGLITKAVSDGNKESIKLFEKYEVKFNEEIKNASNRIHALEDKEANRLLENRKNTFNLIRTGVITTIIGAVSLGIFTNGVSIISEAIKTGSEKGVVINEKNDV